MHNLINLQIEQHLFSEEFDADDTVRYASNAQKIKQKKDYIDKNQYD